MSDTSPPFQSSAVAGVFANLPADAHRGLLTLRELIFTTAKETPGVGRIDETLKWGQPAYLTPDSKSGTTIRLGTPKTGGFAIYVHCQTTLISDFRSLFPDGFAFDGNRAILFEDGQTLPIDALRLFVKNALIYHLKQP
ncbi:DUF1801 domain-containing protein [Aliiroseovarius sp. Z3]|uniref:DUF1801 domain-containing protein n=1 Tax=Aliiroseovarius sp. Z3 TaxID=2811402 RepID=UPI0023B356AE|nr:DUF1801 domain-containing protein [Aliiroseovarius sp. Z3]MDE9449457.1 DUF1801 domain-containing protein [Aliiroseovarius sp. Z3]